MRHYKFCIWVLLFLLNLPLLFIAQNEDSSKTEIHRLNINSKASDFSPFLFENKLYFSSGRENDLGIKYYSSEANQELVDMFCAEKTDSVTFKKIKPISEINTKYNDGPACISKNGLQIFITSNDEKRFDGRKKRPLSIFISEKNNNTWSKPTPLPFCKEFNSYFHPALMNDGKTLIFSSDISDGYGGMDLYYSKLENGIWSAPKNLGPKINSEYNDLFPSISPSDVLYFSSSRENGFGKLDIYSFDIKDSAHCQVKILEPPLNSNFDDFGVWLDSTENSGYFTSNRDTLNEDDIFYFKNKYPAFTNCTPQKKISYCYTFFEESALIIEDTLGMTYEWDFGDGTKKRGYEVKHCFKGLGNYTIQLNIVEKASGSVFSNELSYDFTVEKPKQLVIDCADTIALAKVFILDIKKSIIPDHTIKEIYWFFGDGKSAHGKSVKHSYNSEGEYNLKLGVIARNDATGKLEKFCTEKAILVKDSVWIAKQKPKAH
jgi:hypothetical protein